MDNPTIMLSVLFELDGSTATVQFFGHNDQESTISLVHNSRAGLIEYCMRGDEASEHMHVSHGDSLMVLARREKRTIASAVLEVDCKLAENVDILLLAPCASNVYIEQNSGMLVSSSPLPALDDVLEIDDAGKHTGALPALEQIIAAADDASAEVEVAR